MAGGDSLSHAFQRFEAFEFAAKIIIKAKQLAEVWYLIESQLQQAHERTFKVESFTPLDASIRERELRKDLCDFIQRGCRQRLLISPEGSFFVRLDDQSFVITPMHQDRESLEINDLVLVKQGRMEDGKKQVVQWWRIRTSITGIQRFKRSSLLIQSMQPVSVLRERVLMQGPYPKVMCFCVMLQICLWNSVSQ